MGSSDFSFADDSHTELILFYTEAIHCKFKLQLMGKNVSAGSVSEKKKQSVKTIGQNVLGILPGKTIDIIQRVSSTHILAQIIGYSLI